MSDCSYHWHWCLGHKRFEVCSHSSCAGTFSGACPGFFRLWTQKLRSFGTSLRWDSDLALKRVH